MKFVKISKNGDQENCEEIMNLKNIRKKLDKDGYGVKHLYTWDYEDGSIYCYGCIHGSTGSENKHDLPPNGIKKLSILDNSDTQLLFNDLFLIKKNKKLIDFDISDYEVFYSICFGGFDTCDSEEGEEEESDGNDDGGDEDLDGFIVNDESGEDEEYTIDSDDELDMDINDY
tara:strand:- start:1089 stop:1604 length:516 start_codon:yes stop_codon:yes gene_type:complete